MGRQTAAQRAYSAFRDTVLGRGMIAPGERILAACSGGPDSVGLVELLLRLRDEMPFDLVLAHFNHRLRRSARDDEAFVRERNKIWGLPLMTGSKNVRHFASKKKLNLEEAGRELRYEFLLRSAKKAGATKIATGHTLNDQAETVLMRLMRGSGLKGLGGIAPVATAGPAGLIRPLIGMRRENLTAFLLEAAIPFREDETNLDRRFLRNRIRRGLIPELEKNYEPRIVEHLARLADIAREEESLMGELVRGFVGELVIRKGRDIRLDAKTLAVLSPGLARRVVREFLREMKGDLRAVSFRDVDSVIRLRDGKSVPFGKGRFLRRERGEILLDRPRARRPAAPEILWDGRGRLSFGQAGMTFAGKRMKMAEGARVAGCLADNSVRAAADLNKLCFPLLVRERKPGDRFRPLGAPGRKKLKEILRARGIPKEERGRLPVFLSGDEIVWVPGLPVAEIFKIGKDTVEILIIEKIRPGKPSRPSRR